MPNQKRGYWWIPGMSHPNRGYTREEARLAVGAGWADLAAEAWDLVTAAGGTVTQLKLKHHLLTVYVDGVNDAAANAELHRPLDDLAERSTTICEECGALGDALCRVCARIPGLPLADREVSRHREWVEWDLSRWVSEARAKLAADRVEDARAKHDEPS
jgi:hypothetical protein